MCKPPTTVTPEKKDAFLSAAAQASTEEDVVGLWEKKLRRRDAAHDLVTNELLCELDERDRALAGATARLALETQRRRELGDALESEKATTKRLRTIIQSQEATSAVQLARARRVAEAKGDLQTTLRSVVRLAALQKTKDATLKHRHRLQVYVRRELEERTRR